MVSFGGNSKKNLEAEINLVSFIDLLSVCICYLLLTAVWVQVGTINTKQAIGGQAHEAGPKKPVVWATLGADGSVNLEVKDAPKNVKFKNVKIEGVAGKPNLETFKGAIAAAQAQMPDMKSGIVVPQSKSVYEDLIALMDGLKSSGIRDLGVSAL